MRQRLLHVLVLSFLTFAPLDSTDFFVECKPIAPAHYRIKWEPPTGVGGTTYYFFGSERWSDLMPVEMPSEFLGTGKSIESHFLTTNDRVVDLEVKLPYMRIIADTGGVLCDIAPLLHFPEETDSNTCAIAKNPVPQYDEKEEARKKVQPYLIPENHPCKIMLDSIFSRRGVLTSLDTMRQAGFEILCHREGRGLIVARHPDLRGHLLKTYLDSSRHTEWLRWVRRAKGSRLVRKYIKKYNMYSRDIKAPRKWIYQLPAHAIGPVFPHTNPREYVLVVEDMRILKSEATKWMYQKKVTYRALEGLFVIMEKSGYSDSHIGNLPFSRDRKIAFIDTEYTKNWPVHPEWMTKWLSPQKQNFWNRLILDKGPTRMH